MLSLLCLLCASSLSLTYFVVSYYQVLNAFVTTSPEQVTFAVYVEVCPFVRIFVHSPTGLPVVFLPILPVLKAGVHLNLSEILVSLKRG